MSYAQFEMTTSQDDCVSRAREVFSRANKMFKENPEAKEERMMIMESWKQHEVRHYYFSLFILLFITLYHILVLSFVFIYVCCVMSWWYCSGVRTSLCRRRHLIV